MKETKKKLSKATSRNLPSLPGCKIIHFMLQVWSMVFSFKINVHYREGV